MAYRGVDLLVDELSQRDNLRRRALQPYKGWLSLPGLAALGSRRCHRDRCSSILRFMPIDRRGLFLHLLRRSRCVRGL